MLEVAFYLTGEGDSPVREYLDSLNAKQAAKVLWTISALKAIHPSPSVYLQNENRKKDHEKRKVG